MFGVLLHAVSDTHPLGRCSQVKLSEASLEGGSQHLSFHAVSRQCLCCVCSDPTKGTFVPLTTCGLLLHGHGEDTQAFKLLQEHAEDFVFYLMNRGSIYHVLHG